MSRFIVVGLGLALMLCSGCVLQRLARADVDVSDKVAASPDILGGIGEYGRVADLSDWRERRRAILQIFEDEVYGPIPRGITPLIVERRVVDSDFAKGSARLEELTIALSDAPDSIQFLVALAVPDIASVQRPVPVIVAQNFCDNRGTLGIEALGLPPGGGAEFCDMDGFVSWLLGPVFSNLFAFPLETMLERGFAVAAYSPREIVPDSKELAPEAIERVGELVDSGDRPEGALAVWAASFLWLYDILAADSRLDSGRIAYYGHSRHGKAALLAGAIDPRVGAVVAHQSGTGGAALSRDLAGESIEQIVTSYPHWFASGFGDYHGREEELAVDQHHLLALIAPRPVFIGNAWRDTWSGPNETFRAAVGADPVYRLYGSPGLTQDGMTDSDATGSVVYYIREGLHGHTRSDWRAFMDFLDRVLE